MALAHRVGETSRPSFWIVCTIILVASNGETFFNTAALLSCVQSFPYHRGGTVGILKGFTGLSGAVFTQLYASFFYPDQAKFIFLVAVGPFIVVIILMFFVRPIPPDKTATVNADDVKFNFIYGACVTLAAYLMATTLVIDVIDVSHITKLLFSIGLVLALTLPLAGVIVNILVTHGQRKCRDRTSIDESSNNKTPLLDEPGKGLRSTSSSDLAEFGESDDEAVEEPDAGIKRAEYQRRYSSGLLKAVADGAVKVKRKGPRRGKNFTVSQALVKADFWLVFLTFVCGAGSGLTVIDNMGQIGEAQGYSNSHVFVSLIGIWSFLGRIGAGWASEIVARDRALPRPVVLAVSETIMVVGHLLYAMAWPGSMYIASVLVGFGHGTHWAVVPASVSELFGLKNFGSLYNILTMALPAGTTIFSGWVAGPLYDQEAAKQHGLKLVGEDTEPENKCVGPECFQIAFLVMAAGCVFAVCLNLVLIVRTSRVYRMLYGKSDGEQKSKSGEEA